MQRILTSRVVHFRLKKTWNFSQISKFLDRVEVSDGTSFNSIFILPMSMDGFFVEKNRVGKILYFFRVSEKHENFNQNDYCVYESPSETTSTKCCPNVHDVWAMLGGR